MDVDRFSADDKVRERVDLVLPDRLGVADLVVVTGEPSREDTWDDDAEPIFLLFASFGWVKYLTTSGSSYVSGI